MLAIPHAHASHTGTHIYKHTFTHTHTHTRTRTHTHVHTHAHIHLHTHLHIANIHTHIIHMPTHDHAHLPPNMHTHIHTYIHTIHTSFHTHAHTCIQTKSPDAYMRTCLACSRRESTTCTSSHIRTCETQSSTVQARIHYTHACTCACTRTHACTHPHAHALVGMHTSRHSHRRESAPLCTSVRWNARTVTGAILPAHVQHTLHAIHPLWRGRQAFRA